MQQPNHAISTRTCKSAALLCFCTPVMTNFPGQVAAVLEDLASEKETDSIWFIGSRANRTERADSDWDFIAFVSDRISERSARHDQVDIIRVDPNWNYLLEGQTMEFSGQFKTWRWRKIESGRASYTVRVTPEVGDRGTFDSEDVRFVKLRGLNVWRRNA